MKYILLIPVAILIKFSTVFGQELKAHRLNLVNAWDNVVASIDSTRYPDNPRYYHLIGTYQGWDPDAVYVAGYNYRNLSLVNTKRVFIGNPNGGTNFLLVDFEKSNVGIGTTSPDEKLTVNGKIHATEIKVDLNVPAPDYVFEDDYQLPKLKDIQSYLAKRKHLPEMPSAKEMEKNGLNLSEMNMLLLKKVEELTLHLIRQEGEIEKLKQQLNK